MQDPWNVVLDALKTCLAIVILSFVAWAAAQARAWFATYTKDTKQAWLAKLAAALDQAVTLAVQAIDQTVISRLQLAPGQRLDSNVAHAAREAAVAKAKTILANSEIEDLKVTRGLDDVAFDQMLRDHVESKVLTTPRPTRANGVKITIKGEAS